MFKISIALTVVAAVSASIALAHDVPDAAAVIHMTDAGFEPADVSIKQGETVVFENADDAGRWPASNIHPTHRAYPDSGIELCETDQAIKIFDACRSMQPDETYAFTFHRSGDWRFHDHNLPQFTGVVRVATVPGYISPDKPLEGGDEGFVSKTASSVKLFFLRLSYRLFPSRLEKRLSKVDYFELAEDEIALEELMHLASAERIMEHLLTQSGGGAKIDCHQPAHQIGRIAYDVYGSSVFEQGDASCHSGYYHGAIEGFIAEKGTGNLAEDITEFCSAFDTRFGVFECLHGVGHGVMAYAGYDLPVALDDCRKLTDDFSKQSCYGGVYMENIIAAQGLGAVPGHDTDWVKRGAPHFPCTEVGDDYGTRYECYQMQTSVMLWLNGYDFAATAKECLNALDMTSTCYRSLGRDIAGYTLRDPLRMRDMCETVPKENRYHIQCIVGAANVIADFWGPKLANQVEEFCALLSGEAYEICGGLAISRKQEIFGSTPKP